MLTGDHEQSAQAIAKQSGVARVFASLLPEQKVAKIKELSSAKPAWLAMALTTPLHWPPIWVSRWGKGLTVP